MVTSGCGPENGKKVLTMADCKYCQDEVCVNADCPMRADFCPVPDIPGVCRFEEREEAKNAKQP